MKIPAARIACFSLLLLVLPAFALADSTLSISSPGTVGQGSTFTVGVTISGAVNLYDFQLDLSFNPSVLSATGVSEGVFLSSGGATFFIPGTIDNTDGLITLNADTLLTAISGVSGGGTLLDFDFTAIGSGTSGLGIQNVILQDSNGAILGDTVTNGSVTVQSGTVVTPEPSSLLLFGMGALTLGLLLVKRR
jgi:hypothetical protein